VAVHTYTQTVHRTTQIKIHKRTQIKIQSKTQIKIHRKTRIAIKRMWKCAGRAPSKNAGLTLAFALQLGKKHGKTSVRDEENQSG
jgi:hypothetical protein